MPSEKPDLPKIAYSIREACHVSSLGRTTIYNHIAAGRLRAKRIGGRVVIAVQQAIAQSGGNIVQAARALDVSPSTIYRKLERWAG